MDQDKIDTIWLQPLTAADTTESRLVIKDAKAAEHLMQIIDKKSREVGGCGIWAFSCRIRRRWGK